MYFGVDYYPEHWVFPFGGTAENPEAQWQLDAELMAAAGFNIVRIAEFSWGLCETEDGKYNFDWIKRVMDVMGAHGIQVILATPTAAPPIWLTKKHPEILPIDEQGLTKHEGTRRAVCLNSEVYWSYSKRLVEKMARTLGEHPQLVAWQIDNSLGGNFTEAAFNEDARRDWHLWLEAKYETIEKLNERMGLRHWSQIVSAWNQVPMPMRSPTQHNPALVLDWNRFCSDTSRAPARDCAGWARPSASAPGSTRKQSDPSGAGPCGHSVCGWSHISLRARDASRGARHH